MFKIKDIYINRINELLRGFDADSLAAISVALKNLKERSAQDGLPNKNNRIGEENH